MLLKLLRPFLELASVIEREVNDKWSCSKVHIVQIVDCEERKFRNSELGKGQTTGEICYFLSYWINDGLIDIL